MKATALHWNRLLYNKKSLFAELIHLLRDWSVSESRHFVAIHPKQ